MCHQNSRIDRGGTRGRVRREFLKNTDFLLCVCHHHEIQLFTLIVVNNGIILDRGWEVGRCCRYVLHGNGPSRIKNATNPPPPPSSLLPNADVQVSTTYRAFDMGSDTNFCPSRSERKTNQSIVVLCAPKTPPEVV